MHRRLVSLSAALLLTAPAAPALAQDGGVTVDNGAPSSKEYAIPLESARQNAAGGGQKKSGKQGDRSAPLFGEGVGDGAPTTAAGGSASTTGGDQSGSASSSGSSTSKRGASGSGSSSGGSGSNGSSGSASGSDSGSGGSNSSSGSSSASGQSGSAPANTATTVKASTPDGGFGSTATIGAVAISVLLLGGVLGSIARRRNA